MGRGPNPLKRQSLENPKPPRPRASTVGFAKNYCANIYEVWNKLGFTHQKFDK